MRLWTCWDTEVGPEGVVGDDDVPCPGNDTLNRSWSARGKVVSKATLLCPVGPL